MYAYLFTINCLRTIYIWEKEITDHQRPASEFVPIDVTPDHFEPHQTNLYATFARCIQTGIPAHPDFEDGLICQKVLDAVDESIQTGRAVSLNRPGERSSGSALRF